MTRRADMIQRAISAAIDEVRVSMPGRVEKVDITAQTVDVRPLLIHRLIDDEGTVTQEELPVIPAVPISWLRAGEFFVTMPIAKGDTGLLIFCDWPIDQWLARGGDAPVDPLDIRAHSLTSATFTPGLHHSKNPIADAHAENMVMGKDGGSQIHIKPDGEIHIGSESAAEFVALAQKVLDELNSVNTDLAGIKSSFDTHTHILAIAAASGAGGTGTAAPPASAAPTPHTPASVAATKVKAD